MSYPEFPLHYCCTIEKFILKEKTKIILHLIVKLNNYIQIVNNRFWEFRKKNDNFTFNIREVSPSVVEQMRTGKFWIFIEKT